MTCSNGCSVAFSDGCSLVQWHFPKACHLSTGFSRWIFVGVVHCAFTVTSSGVISFALTHGRRKGSPFFYDVPAIVNKKHPSGGGDKQKDKNSERPKSGAGEHALLPDCGRRSSDAVWGSVQCNLSSDTMSWTTPSAKRESGDLGGFNPGQFSLFEGGVHVYV